MPRRVKFEDTGMEVLVYWLYLLGFMAAFSALVVQVFARLPADVMMRGAGNGRFADIGLDAFKSRGAPAAGGRVQGFDVPKPHAV